MAATGCTSLAAPEGRGLGKGATGRGVGGGGVLHRGLECVGLECVGLKCVGEEPLSGRPGRRELNLLSRGSRRHS